MSRLLIGTGAAALLAVLPFAFAQEAPKAAPSEAKPGAKLFQKCDLNKDGKVDWEEFQKVRSGFAHLDADGDGFITEADVAKRAEEMKQKFQDRFKEQMRERMQGWMRERMPPGMGHRMGRTMGPGMGPGMGPERGHRMGRGDRGPERGPRQEGMRRGEGGRGGRGGDGDRGMDGQEAAPGGPRGDRDGFMPRRGRGPGPRERRADAGWEGWEEAFDFDAPLPPEPPQPPR